MAKFRHTTAHINRSSGLPALRFALLLAAARSVSMTYGVTLRLLPTLLPRNIEVHMRSAEPLAGQNVEMPEPTTE